MKKRVLLVSPMLHQGGFERVCIITAGLLKEICDVSIVIFSDKDIAYDISGLDVINLNLGTVPGAAGKIKNVVLRVLAMRRLKKNVKADVTYSFGPTANLVNVLSAGTGKVFTSVRSFMDLDRRKQLAFFASHSYKMICCSRTIRQTLEEDPGIENLCTLYNPFDLEDYERRAGLQVDGKNSEELLPFAPGTKVVAAMGREDDVKGFWHLMKAFALLHRRIPDTGLLIVGEGDFMEYRKLAEGLGIADSVCFPGVQKNPFPWFRASDLYVMTSLNEGFPNVLVEAMCLGLPVISTNCMTGPAEILSDRFELIRDKEEYRYEKYGVLIPNLERVKDLDPTHITGEEERLSQVMEKLLIEENLAASYRAASLERAKDFSCEKYLEQLKEIFEL